MFYFHTITNIMIRYVSGLCMEIEWFAEMLRVTFEDVREQLVDVILEHCYALLVYFVICFAFLHFKESYLFID